MKSTELHSDSVIQQGESIPTTKIGQVKKNKKSGIVTFPASSPLTDWTAKHKKSSSGLPTEPDGAKLKPDENAGKMNFVSNFATDPSYFPLPESGVVIERIEQLETRYKLNHTEIAKEIGISRGTVHAVLKGRAPTQKLVRKLDAAEKRLEASTLQTPSTNKSMLVFAMNRAIPEEVQTGPNQVFVRPKGTDGNTNRSNTEGLGPEQAAQRGGGGGGRFFRLFVAVRHGLAGGLPRHRSVGTLVAESSWVVSASRHNSCHFLFYPRRSEISPFFNGLLEQGSQGGHIPALPAA
jgi:DNA-binding XRE family transcriptional regulator